MFCLKRRLRWDQMSEREININQPEISLTSNKISTAKYNLLTFVPKNLFE